MHPCNVHEDRRWIVETNFAHRQNDIWRAGFSVSYQDRKKGSSLPRFGVPRFLRKLDHEIGIEIDAQKLFPHAMALEFMYPDLLVHDRVDFLIHHLSNPHRKHPVVLVSNSDVTNLPLLNPGNLQKHLFGLAFVIGLNKEETFYLSDNIGRSNSVYNGAIRLIKPGSIISAEQALLTPKELGDIARRYPRNFEAEIAKRVTREFMLELGEKDIPSFSTVKSALLSAKIENLKQETAAIENAAPVSLEKPEEAPVTRSFKAETSPELPPEIKPVEIEPVTSEAVLKLKKTVQALKDVITAQGEQLSEAQHQVEEALGMAVAEHEQGKQFQQALSAVTQERNSLKDELDTVPKSASILKGIFPPLSLVGEWADAVLPGKVLITKSAVKSAKESQYRFPDIAYKGILELAGLYREMRLSGFETSGSLRQHYLDAIRMIGLEDRLSVSPKLASSYDSRYFTHVGENVKLFLDHHLCKGDTFEEKNCLRIYFTWHEKTKQVVIGHLPSHLMNSMT